MLGIVPQGRHCISVEIIHDPAGSSARVASELDKFVHEAMIKSLLLGHIVMVLVGGINVRTVDPRWLKRIGIER